MILDASRNFYTSSNPLSNFVSVFHWIRKFYWASSRRRITSLQGLRARVLVKLRMKNLSYAPVGPSGKCLWPTRWMNCCSRTEQTQSSANPPPVLYQILAWWPNPWHSVKEIMQSSLRDCFHRLWNMFYHYGSFPCLFCLHPTLWLCWWRVTTPSWPDN